MGSTPTRFRQLTGNDEMGKGKKTPKQAVTRFRRRYGWLLGGIAALVAVAVIGWFAYQSAANLPGIPVPDLGNAHIQTLSEPHLPYNSDPPTSGPHLSYIAPWGIHGSPIPKELQVHNLEDGGVLVQYNCPQGCAELVEKLKGLVSRHDKQVILAPYTGMDKRIALTAWGRIDKFDEFDEKRIARFINAYRGIDHHAR